MDIGRRLPGYVWDLLPAAAFRPQPGDLTTHGATLSLRPPLSAPDKLKFAAVTDLRFRKRHLYHKLLPFLPEGFEVVGPPNRRNCWLETLGKDPEKGRPFQRPDFDAELTARGSVMLDYDPLAVREGDIIVYAVLDAIEDVRRRHAALYIGNGRVRDRFGINAPLLEHPLEAVPPSYWNKDPALLCIERLPDSRVTS